MDVIVSAAFGFAVDSQLNPGEPILNAARMATNQSALQQVALTFLTLLPFGTKIIEEFPSLWIKNLKPLINTAEEIVRIKRESSSNSTRKVIQITHIAKSYSFCYEYLGASSEALFILERRVTYLVIIFL